MTVNKRSLMSCVWAHFPVEFLHSYIVPGQHSEPTLTSLILVMMYAWVFFFFFFVCVCVCVCATLTSWTWWDELTFLQIMSQVTLPDHFHLVREAEGTKQCFNIKKLAFLTTVATCSRLLCHRAVLLCTKLRARPGLIGPKLLLDVGSRGGSAKG